MSKFNYLFIKFLFKISSFNSNSFIDSIVSKNSIAFFIVFFPFFNFILLFEDYKKPKKEIEENINKLKENNIQIDDYFFDKFDEPETTIILTIINNIKNRDKIFNKDYKYIGINFNKNDKGLFIVIFSFSK